MPSCSLFWRYFVETGVSVSMFDLLLPFALTLITLILLQLVGALILPVRWSAVRDEFRRAARDAAGGGTRGVYGPIPAETAEALLRERARVDELLVSVREVRTWLEERQTAASISGLYGS